MNKLFLSAALVVEAAAIAPWEPPAGPPCKDCPNIVLMFTDDQDMIIGGWDRMDQTKERIQSQGVLATEWRIHTPVCAPSRSELQSGRYYHTINSHQITPPSRMSSGGVDHVDLGGKVYPYHFATTLRSEKGYTTGLFGKCMNGGCQQHDDKYDSNKTANLHQMGAFDRWFEGIGYENTTFFDNMAEGCEWPWNSTKCETPTFPGGIWSGKGDGYDTSTVGNMTVDWIRSVAGKGRPFFAYVAIHAPHSPSTPAPWYKDDEFCSGIQSPRTPNWNYSGVHHATCSDLPPSGPPPLGDEPVYWWDGADFHELISCFEYYDAEMAENVDRLARNRCKTLYSVDDAYAGILDVLQETNVFDNTYVLVTSDHGYNLGQHMLPSNKFLIYEHSLRIPMLFMGPGIPRNSTIDLLATQVDLAPTILGLAGIDTPAYMDGRSIVGNLITNSTAAPGSVADHLRRYTAIDRTSSFVEYYTQGPMGSHPTALDDWSNTYIGVTYNGAEGKFKFGIFDPYGPQTNFTKPYMFELFDLVADPYELHNIYNATVASNPKLVSMLTETTYEWYRCEGASCK